MLFNLNVTPASFFAFEFSLINKKKLDIFCLLNWPSTVGLHKLVRAGLVDSRKALKLSCILCVELNIQEQWSVVGLLLGQGEDCLFDSPYRYMVESL